MSTASYSKATVLGCIPLAVLSAPVNSQGHEVSVPKSVLAMESFVFYPDYGMRSDDGLAQAVNVDVAEPGLNLREPVTVLPWTGYDQRQFHKLLIKKLSSGLTNFERDQFAKLQRKREQTQEPLPPEAIEARERLDSKIDEVLALLDELIEPLPQHESSHRPRPTA